MARPPARDGVSRRHGRSPLSGVAPACRTRVMFVRCSKTTPPRKKGANGDVGLTRLSPMLSCGYGQEETEPESNSDAIGGGADFIYSRPGSARNETENAKTMPSGKAADRLRWKRRPDDIRRGGTGSKLIQGLLLAAAALAGLVPGAGARAADLPAFQAAPIEYVRICDAYGAGFFYIPGTDTCLRVGGLALAELRGFDPSFTIVGPQFYANGAQHLGAGFVPSPSQYSNARSRDAIDYAALGRAELDARTRRPGAPCDRSFVSTLSSGRVAAPLSAVLASK